MLKINHKYSIFKALKNKLFTCSKIFDITDWVIHGIIASIIQRASFIVEYYIPFNYFLMIAKTYSIGLSIGEYGGK